MSTGFFTNQPSPDEVLERVKSFQVWMEVDLDAIGHNLKVVKELTGAEVIPCVKRDSYAHGLPTVVAYLSSQGVRRFLVAKTSEARRIREAGLDCGVINMDPAFTQAQCDEAVVNDFTQVAYHRDTGLMLNEAAKKYEKAASIWVKVDTGLGRAGVDYRDAAELIEFFTSLPCVEVEGVFSTLLEDEKDALQIIRFNELKETLLGADVKIPTWSMASSHGVFFRPDAHYHAVRPGIMLYGFYPTPEARKTGVELRQALCLKSRLEHVKWVEKGTPLTYGAAFVAPRRMKVGTMHMGYSDGYPRQLSKRGIVSVDGKIRPIVGGVSINHSLVDLTGVNAEKGSIVEAISREGKNSIQSLCDIAGIEPYQLLVWTSPLMPRVYYMDGLIVALSEPELYERKKETIFE
jgi:alanine racemase